MPRADIRDLLNEIDVSFCIGDLRYCEQLIDDLFDHYDREMLQAQPDEPGQAMVLRDIGAGDN